MRRVVAVILALLLAREASAQVAVGPPARIEPTQAEAAAQATFDTSYLLALYMTQLAAAGAAPSQADIEEAARQYFVNGATVTGVPSSGPGAAYFTNGAAVTGVPSSGPGAAYFTSGAEVLAYSAPRVTPAPDESGKAVAALVGSPSCEEDAGVQRPVASTEEAAPMGIPASGIPAARTAKDSDVGAGARTATGSTCSPVEIEAAVAITRQFAMSAASPPSVTSCSPLAAPAPVPPPGEMAATFGAEPAPSCPPGPSPLSRLAVALGGAFLGGLSVALWLRPRMLRVAQGG